MRNPLSVWIRREEEKEKASQVRVLFIDNSTRYEIFHEMLLHTLKNLGCVCEVPSSVEEVQSILQSEELFPKIILFDPRNSFLSARDLQRQMVNSCKNEIPKIIGLRLHPKDEDAFVSDLLPIRGMIAKTYIPSEIAFVIHPFLPHAKAERRRHPRVLATVPIDYKGRTQDRFHADEVFNLSVGGLYLQSFRENARGGTLKLVLHLPDSPRPFRCTGKTVFKIQHCLSQSAHIVPGMGIEFCSLTVENRNRLHKFVEERMKDTFGLALR